MKEEALNETITFFPYLFEDYDFQITEESYERENFGNFFIILEGTDFRVRFVRDRGQVFVDVGPINGDDDWYDLRIVLEFLKRNESIDFTETELRELGWLLKINYKDIQNLFKKPRYLKAKDELRQFRREKVEKRLNIKIK